MDINTIIYKFLKGSHSDEELQILEDWKSEAVDNLIALEEMKNINAIADELKDYRTFSSEDRWNAISDTIVEQPKIWVHPARKWGMAAAAILTLFVSAFFLFNLDRQELPTNFVAEENNLNISLPDGSLVALDDHSSLERMSDFEVTRNVQLKGRAFFEIEKDSRPFAIQLNKGIITVLGTKFSVFTTNNHQEIYVTEGSVLYELGDRKMELVAGDFIKVLNEDIIRMEQNNSNYFSWKEEKITFVDDNLAKIVGDLNLHFKTNITLQKDIRQTNCKLSTVFQSETLEEVLEELRQVIGIEYIKTGNKILITSVNC